MTWVLQLNDMRSAHYENREPVARAETRAELEQFVAAERVETYRTDDGRWAKSFKQGGPLEWYNPPDGVIASFVDVGTEEDWGAHACQQYRETVLAIPVVSG